MFLRLLLVASFLLSFAIAANAKDARSLPLKGRVLSAKEEEPLGRVAIDILQLKKRIHSDSVGRFSLDGIPAGRYTLRVSLGGYETLIDSVDLSDTTELDLRLTGKTKFGADVTVYGILDRGNGTAFMPAVLGTSIYEGKKNEVILVGDLDANRATNNPRQIFSKVPGINVIENDGGGVQVGVAVRGLNPNRITEFNSRQNGYDISADALGYPESYYTPPTEGLKRIEVVRGAASLQYGSQFGGLLNFVMQDGPRDKTYQFETSQTGGSNGFFNSYNSLGGTLGKLNYFGFYHHKQGDGWRENSGYAINTGYANARFAASDAVTIGFDLTVMDYNMQQAGGLTEAQFAADPRQATRNRNWFNASWRLPALTLDYVISPVTKFNTRVFALLADRSSVGNLIAPNQPDNKINRNLMTDEYENFGGEARLVHSYTVADVLSTALVGVRYYRGNTHRMQGFGSTGADADFNFVDPQDLEGSDYEFPSTNIAAFAENIFALSDKLAITPGIRWEMIRTNAEGYFKNGSKKQFEEKTSKRSFPLLGLGVSYYVTPAANLYANISQAYTGVNFNDIRVVNQSFRVDSNLKDVTGYNADFGFRGRLFDHITFDVGGFYLAYNDRIGVINTADDDYNIYRYRTNVSDSRSLGVESFIELELMQLIDDEADASLSVYNTLAYVDARYTNSVYKAVQGSRVEYAPEWLVRSGLSYKTGGFSATAQFSYTSEQFTDATNTRFTLNAINGLIPAYQVIDLSGSYKFARYTIGAGINNVLDAMYYTRRADGYPGPGILPADGRSVYVSAGLTL